MFFVLLLQTKFPLIYCEDEEFFQQLLQRVWYLRLNLYLKVVFLFIQKLLANKEDDYFKNSNKNINIIFITNFFPKLFISSNQILPEIKHFINIFLEFVRCRPELYYLTWNNKTKFTYRQNKDTWFAKK